MPRILLNRLEPKAEEIIKEQVGFRAGRSTTEQIFNIKILCEKCRQHQQIPYHAFVDLMKAFDRVWHAALLATFNINANLIRTIECHYNKATSAVYHDNNIGEWFRTTVGVHQGYLLFPTLFSIFLERIIADVLEDHEEKVSIGDRTITFFLRHLRPSWRRTRAGQFGKSPWRGLQGIWHAGQCREDPADDNQHQWHQHWHYHR